MRGGLLKQGFVQDEVGLFEARFNVAEDWRVAPRAPLGRAIGRASMGDITMPKMGPGDF